MADAPTVEVGQQVGRFGLIRELARGGMGQVFLARDTKLGRKVAIKFLLDSTPSFVQRFVIEAKATALCTHENIVTIFEVGEHAGLPFMVLEYLQGKTLTELLADRPTPRAFAELMVPVVRALERAHEHGIVHRDLKPSNIFVTDRGIVKVLDFGVAKLFDAPAERAGGPRRRMPSTDGALEQSYVTFSGNGWIVGTLPYMSPEQWGAGEVDHLSDIWAIGILWWRALTGVHPAGTGDPKGLLERLTKDATPLPSIGSRVPDLPPEIVEVVDRCLALDKAKRMPSASALLAALTAFLAPREDDEIVELDTEVATPYRGLAPFGEDDARNFYGRTSEIRSALAHLEAWPLLAVVGPSGVGKSSFIHAGLVPAIRATGTWRVIELRPGRAPIASLAAIAPVTAEAPGELGETLRAQARRDGTQILIVVDQLEELFTLSTDVAARAAFLHALLGAADDASAPVRVVLSMRADFLDRLAADRAFLDELTRGLFFLSAPDRDHLRETLVRPAERAGYAFEDTEIVDDIVSTAARRGALPLLQFAATRLWDARDRGTKQLTRAAYDAMGGVAGAFVRHADEIAAAVPPQHQPQLRAVMTRLVTPEGTRAVIDRDELRSLGGEPAVIERILDQLVRGRLVHVHADAEAGATVEIVHEALITEWPTLRRWLEDNHALRGFAAELRAAAKQWAARGKPADLVWRGATARDALATAKRHAVELDLTAAEREFLAEAGREAARSGRRRALAWLSVVGVLCAVIALGAVALVRISDAETRASKRALDAANEAQRARAAEADSARELAAAREAERRREAAEAEARAQSAAVKAEAEKRVRVETEKQQVETEKKSAEAAAAQASRAMRSNQEDSETTSAQLETAVDRLEAKNAELARELEQARKDFEDVRGSNLRLQSQLAAEQARGKQREASRGETLK